MKILLKKDKSYIVEVSEEEIASIVGEESHYRAECKINEAIKYSKEQEISKLYKDYHRLIDFKKSQYVTKAATHLRQLADQLDPLEEVFQIIPIPDGKEAS